MQVNQLVIRRAPVIEDMTSIQISSCGVALSLDSLQIYLQVQTVNWLRVIPSPSIRLLISAWLMTAKHSEQLMT